MAQAGFPAVALMGCSMSDEQEKLLPFHVILCMDGDEVGQTAAKELLPRIAKNHFVRVAYLPERKQPDSLSSEELHRLLPAHD